MTALGEISQARDDLAAPLPVQQALAVRARAAHTRLRATHVEAIFSHGLHDWPTGFIVETNAMAKETPSAFGFGVDLATALEEGAQQVLGRATSRCQKHRDIA